MAMKRIFISSVQKEFAKERRQLAKYIRYDPLLRLFFDVFLFEETPAQERNATDVYLNEVGQCDIYLGIHGRTYGNTNASGISATEQEYDEAGKQNKERICFVKKCDTPRDFRQEKFIKKISGDIVRKVFTNYNDLQGSVYAALANYLFTRDYISAKPFDESTNADIELSHLSINKIRSFVKRAKEKRDYKAIKGATPERILTSLGLINDTGRILNPAALLFGKNPQKHFITSEVKCIQFFADQVSKPLADYQIYKGDVFELVDQATYFVMTHIRNWVGTRDSGETAAVPTKFELPYDAVKEAIVNAVCHRDYTSKASVQVMLFSDRLEIMSPGALPRGMTIAKLSRPHKSIPVNPHLANAMYLAGYVERAGTGTEDIIDKCKQWGLLAPVWEDDGDFKVIIYRENLLESATSQIKNDGGNDGENDGEKSNVIKELSNKEKIVFIAIKTNPHTTSALIARDKKIARPTIERAIKKLKLLGLIKRIGPDKGGHWEVK